MHDAYSFILGAWYADNINDVMNQTRGYFTFEAVLGADFKDNDDFDVLIGMDIITQGTLTVAKQDEFSWVLGA